MTTTILARFVDGKLFIQESKLAIGGAAAGAYGEGIPVRVGHVGHIDAVIEVGTNLAKLGLLSPLDQVMSAKLGTPVVRLFRGDRAPVATALMSGFDQAILSARPLSMSGCASLGLLSGITSGLAFGEEVGAATKVSGLLTMTINVIGY
jgi:hypothetical protein